VKFLRSKDEVPEFVIKFLKMIQVYLNAIIQNIRTDNGREFVNQPPRAYYEDVWISHQTSVAHSPQPNDVAKAVATSCYTQNRSLIRKRHNKTPYELLHNKKPDLSYLHVFGALCYPTNDSEDLGKLKPKADIGIFVGYALAKKAYRIYNKRTRLIIETIHVDFDELTAIASKQFSSGPEPQLLNPGTISSGLVPNPPSPTPYVPPILRYDLGLIMYRVPCAIKGVLRKNTKNLNTKINKLNEELSNCETDLYNYKRGFIEYTVVPPPPVQVYSPPKKDLSWTGLPEYVDDTVTDYTRPTPSVDVSKDVRTNLDGNNTSIFDQGETSGSNMSWPMIKFVKESGCPNAIKINNTKKSRKPTVKYVEMYRCHARSLLHDCSSTQYGQKERWLAGGLCVDFTGPFTKLSTDLHIHTGIELECGVFGIVLWVTLSSASWTHTRGIHQIQNDKDDVVMKLSTSQGVYCYTRAFGLKNAEGATYPETGSLSKSADKFTHLIQTLKKCTKERENFPWTTEHEKPSRSSSSIIAALPTTQGTEIKYSAMDEDLYLALVFAGTKKDAQYFQAHPISGNHRSITSKQWKGQILADFLLSKKKPRNVPATPPERSTTTEHMDLIPDGFVMRRGRLGAGLFPH
ncbi:retrovirus-related pol polyprotein from transposon TNT 1-94, partial [Tanacetum coccineum]